MNNPISIDLETTGLNYRKDHITNIFSTDSKLQSRCYTPNDMIEVRQLASNIEQPKVFHNAKFDLRFLQDGQCCIQGKIHDTMIMSHILNEQQRQKDLKTLSVKYLSYDMINANKYKDWTKRYGYDNVPEEILIPYGMDDADNTIKLYYLFHNEIEREFKQLYEMEIALLQPIMAIERNGMRIDTEYCYAKSQYLQTLIDNIQQSLGAINLKSSKQLINLLYNKLNLECTSFTDKGNQSVDEDALLLHKDNPTVKLILKYRLYKKWQEFFEELLAVQEDEIVYPNMHSTGTVTGRFSCSNPNLQQIPKENEEMSEYSVRKAFIPRDDCSMVFFDYQQMEVAAMAYQFNEQHLIQALANNIDIHNMTAKDINADEIARMSPKKEYHNNTRFIGKTFNFAIPYGMSATGLSNGLGIPKDVAQKYLNNYFNANPNLKQAFVEVKKQLAQRGYVKNFFGRRFRTPYEDSYKAVNAWIQGLCADVMKTAMNALHLFLQASHPEWKLLMVVHDEFIIELPTEEVTSQNILATKQCIENSNPTNIPFKVDCKVTSTNWAEKKGFEI